MENGYYSKGFNKNIGIASNNSLEMRLKRNQYIMEQLNSVESEISRTEERLKELQRKKAMLQNKIEPIINQNNTKHASYTNQNEPERE